MLVILHQNVTHRHLQQQMRQLTWRFQVDYLHTIQSMAQLSKLNSREMLKDEKDKKINFYISEIFSYFKKLPAKTSLIARDGKSFEPLKLIDLGELRTVKSLQDAARKKILSHVNKRKINKIFGSE